MSEPEPVKRKRWEEETEPRTGEKRPRREIDVSQLLSDLNEQDARNKEASQLGSLSELKKYLTTSERIAKFLAVEPSSSPTPASSSTTPLTILIQLFKRLSMEAVAPAMGCDGNDQRRLMLPSRQNLLAEVISLLGNVCHLSSTAREMLSSPSVKLSSLAAELLEVPAERLQPAVKQNLLRLFGNLIDRDRQLNGPSTSNSSTNGTLPVVVTNSRLLDRVVMALVRSGGGGDEDEEAITVMAQRALRIVSKLAASGRMRVLKHLIAANVGYYLAESLSTTYPDSSSLLSKGEKHLQVLYNLTLCGASDLGRQVARSGNDNCLRLLLDVVSDATDDDNDDDAEEDSKMAETRAKWVAGIMRMVRDSGELRAAFGRGAIQRLNEERASGLGHARCQFLCYFTQDAWSRVELRESGALGKVLDVFESCDGGEEGGDELYGLKTKISCYFRPFGHDQATLTYLCQRPNFVTACLAHINAYLGSETYHCPPLNSYETNGQGGERVEEQMEEGEGSDEAVEGDAKLPSHHAPSPYRPAADASSPLYPGFMPSPSNLHRPHFNWSPAMSPNPAPSPQASNSPATSSPARRPSMSPSMQCTSPPRLDSKWVEVWTEDGDELSRASSSFPTSQQSEEGDSGREEEERDGPENEVVGAEGEGESGTEAESARKRGRRERIAYNCIDLLLLLTHYEENYAWLVRPELLHTLIRFIADAPPAPLLASISLDRLARSLMRLARCRKNIETLFAMNFHFELVERLVWRECLRKVPSGDGSARWCRRCSERRDLGRQVFAEFAKLMDSDFGWSLLMMALQSRRREETGDSSTELLAAHASALMMIRRPERSRRLFHNWLPVETLISALTDLIQRGDEGDGLPRYMSPVVWRILMAFSSLLTREVVNANMPLRAVEVVEDDAEEDEGSRCVVNEDEDGERGNLLKFYSSKTASTLLVVKKERICESSDYFKGMFTSDFAETALSKQRFAFDSAVEGCSPADFTIFLHLLSGCHMSSACCRITTADTCTAMLRLADKYLARRLLKSLKLKATGMLSGETLGAFLPLALQVASLGEELGRRCCLVLLRYSTRLQMEDALGRVAEGGKAMVEEFGVMLQDLLTSSVCQLLSIASGPPTTTTNQQNCWREWCV